MTVQEKAKILKDLEEKLGSNVVNTLKELFQNLNEESTKEVSQRRNSEIQLKREVTNIIREIGIPSNLKGYQYLREAIMLVYKNPEYINLVTKILYPKVAKVYKTTDKRVERSIRHAIELAWSKSDDKILHKYFGSTDKPTNSRVIADITDFLHLKHNE